MEAKILKNLEKAVVEGQVSKAKEIAKKTIAEEIPVNSSVEALLKAMKVVDKLYERKEYFVVDVASAAAAMKEAFSVFEPHIKVEPVMMKGKIVIGSLKGNIQGLGKDIVAATLRAAGFQVVNIGVDVPPEEFVKVAVREHAQIIGISISMEETIPYLKEVVDLLERGKLRNKIKVLIGGNAVSEKIRIEYEIDAYASDAQESVEKVKTLLN